MPCAAIQVGADLDLGKILERVVVEQVDLEEMTDPVVTGIEVLVENVCRCIVLDAITESVDDDANLALMNKSFNTAQCTTREAVRRMLAPHNDIVFHYCQDPKQALAWLQKGERFDLAILDMVMPEMGGLEVLKHAKKINPDIIVIIVTGYASLETAVAAIKEGAYDYIIKPCKLDEIRIVIDRAIEKIKLYKENRELLEKLQNAYRDLMALDINKASIKSKGHDFVSSNLAGLHHLYDNPDQDCIDKLQMLSNLKDTGAITGYEFKEFKRHYLKTMAMGN